MFKSFIFFLIFCVLFLSIIEKGVFKYLTVSVGLSICFVVLLVLPFMCFEALLLVGKSFRVIYSG